MEKNSILKKNIYTKLKYFLSLFVFFPTEKSWSDQSTNLKCHDSLKKILAGFDYQKGSVFNGYINKSIIKRSDLENNFLEPLRSVISSVPIPSTNPSDLIRRDQILATYLKGQYENTSAAVSLGLITFDQRYQFQSSSSGDLSVPIGLTRKKDAEIGQIKAPSKNGQMPLASLFEKYDSVELYTDSRLKESSLPLENWARGVDLNIARHNLNAAQEQVRPFYNDRGSNRIALELSKNNCSDSLKAASMDDENKKLCQDLRQKEALFKKLEATLRTASKEYVDLVNQYSKSILNEAELKPKSIKVVKSGDKIKSIDVLFSSGEYAQMPCTEDGLVDFSLFSGLKGANSTVMNMLIEPRVKTGIKRDSPASDGPSKSEIRQ